MYGKRIVAVFGATGAQGGSVAKYLLEDKTVAVRAITRNAQSPAAQALKAKGAEVVVADLNHPETLFAVVNNAYSVYGVTDCEWEAEFQHGKALVDAAKLAGVQHFIWWCVVFSSSTFPHYDSKAQVDEYLKASGIPHTSLYNCGYFENLISPVSGFQLCKKLDDGTISVEIPIPADSYMAFYSVDQTGGWVLEALKNPSRWIGKDMHAIGQHITPRQVAEKIAAITGKTSALNVPSLAAFRAMGESEDPAVKEVFLGIK
ncbi:NAD(P)-binding protein [Exidia glandulosa HHB12029]|uniref:NAD(P)-binding protein n=1 Tax=Exidia glandulosa HHB12029 TaxID=1314781 RepID=A0A165C2D1_EXIGL|nr:NAD(P)-binding protein [Exidia glandulosa HHB12029]